VTVADGESGLAIRAPIGDIQEQEFLVDAGDVRRPRRRSPAAEQGQAAVHRQRFGTCFELNLLCE
jgi:hypothetical protein